MQSFIVASYLSLVPFIFCLSGARGQYFRQDKNLDILILFNFKQYIHF